MIESAPPKPLPPEIRVEQSSPDRVRYVFPRRPLGRYRWLAVVPIAFGLIGVTFFWEWFAVVAQAPMPIGLIFGAVGAFICIGGVVAPIAIGAAMVCGHSSIEIRGDYLWSNEHIGPFRLGRRLPLAQIKRLEVGSSAGRNSLEQDTTLSAARLAAMRIQTPRGRTRMAAIGYPREWLMPLAHELAQRIGVAQAQSEPAAATGQPADTVKVVEVADERRPIERFEQPANSRIVMTEQPESLTFEIPPVGIKGAARALFVFACIWLAFMAVFTPLFVGGLLKRAQQPQAAKEIWIAIPAIGLFWLVGVGMMLGAIQMARRRAAIAVANGRCLVIQAGLFGEKKRIWEAGELKAVQMGASGVEVNDVPVMELQFIPCAGKKFGVLSARDDAELEWLATRLTKALGLVAARPGGAILADIDAQPADSDVVCEQLPDALTISVPRARWRKGPLGWWTGALIWNAIIATVMTAFIVSGRKNVAESLFPLAVLSALGLAGIGLIGMAIQATIQHAEIAFASGRLLVLRFGLFGKRRNEWAAEELAAVRASASSTRVNNRPLMQLQIVPIRGKPVAFLTGRDDQELAWIATLLRRALQVPAETD